MSSGVDDIILMPQVVGGVVHLHCLNRVYYVVGDDHRVTFLVSEDVVTKSNVELPQPIKDMVL